MSYAPIRPHINKSTRTLVLRSNNGNCYLCGLAIVGNDFDVDHELARELGGSDGLENLRPAHHACHVAKTKRDVALIAKGNRIRKKISGLDPITRRPRKAIPSRPMQSNNTWPKRPMRSRAK